MARWRRAGSTRVWRMPRHHAAALRWQGARRPCGGGRPCGGVGSPAGRPCGGEGRPGCLGHYWAAGDPLLAPIQDYVEFVGISGKTNMVRRRRRSRRGTEMASWHPVEAYGVKSGRMVKALGLRREVGHVATLGLADVPETSRGKVWRFLQNRRRTRFRQFSKNCPCEDSRRTCGDIGVIASGRSKYLQVVAAVGWSSMYLFRFCPYGLSSLVLLSRGSLVFLV